MGSEDDAHHIYIEEMSKLLDRRVHTIRQWIGGSHLPRKLMPKREGGRRKIYWTEDQVEGLKKFAEERSRSQGWKPSNV